jgi:hypothetical protein
MVVAYIIQICQVLGAREYWYRCDGITTKVVFSLVMGSHKFMQLGVEENKISKVTMKLASKKNIVIRIRGFSF